MAYTYDKQLWKDYPDTSTPITADRLNHMEDGISEAAKSGGGDTIPVGSEFDYDGTEVPEGFQQVDDPDEYSTEEKIIGTWTDGKPLYRKTVGFTTGSSSNVWTTISGLANIKDIPYYSGYIYMSDTEAFLVPSSNANNCPYFSVNKSSHTAREAHTNDSCNSKTCVITFNYTKTTD